MVSDDLQGERAVGKRGGGVALMSVKMQHTSLRFSFSVVGLGESPHPNAVHVPFSKQIVPMAQGRTVRFSFCVKHVGESG